MPTYAYKCNDCGSKFEVFHKVKENLDDVVCPSCESNSSKKLISASNIGGVSSGSSYDIPAKSPCASGSCPFV